MAQAEMEVTEEEAADFADFLSGFGHGAVNRMLSKRMRELVAAARLAGSKGSITLTINVAAKGEMAGVEMKVKTNKPEMPLPSGLYFTSEEGGLTSEDPRQLKLPARVLDAGNRVPRIVKSGGGDT
jgi:hypothetical protein